MRPPWIKNQINLLPESIQQQQRNRKNLKWIAAVQVAIFLCIALLVSAFNAASHRSWGEANYEAERANAIAQDTRQLDLTAQEQAQRQQAEADFLGNYAPPHFDAGWLFGVLVADTGNTTAISYDGRDILLTGQTDDIGNIESHRQRLLDTEGFIDVNLGRITQQTDNVFHYELRAIVR